MSEDRCLECQNVVRPRQEALQCEGCDGWQHRTCKTGVLRSVYREAVKNSQEIAWCCRICNLTVGAPAAESTRINEIDEVSESVRMDTVESENTMVDDGIENELENGPQMFAGEPSIEEELPIYHDPGDGSHITYKVIEDGTQRRKLCLLDSAGFTYNVNSKRPYATYWQCTVRPKEQPCKASVIERNGIYEAGKSTHNHQVPGGAYTAKKIMATIKTKALEDKFKPASAIVDEVLLEHLGNGPCAALPKAGHMARAANRLRQSMRPEDPKNLGFQLADRCIPENFLQADIATPNTRHLVFAKPEQLYALSRAKTWYVDGTFS